jgi:hypothetical protein
MWIADALSSSPTVKPRVPNQWKTISGQVVITSLPLKKTISSSHLTRANARSRLLNVHESMPSYRSPSMDFSFFSGRAVDPMAVTAGVPRPSHVDSHVYLGFLAVLRTAWWMRTAALGLAETRQAVRPKFVHIQNLFKLEKNV